MDEDEGGILPDPAEKFEELLSRLIFLNAFLKQLIGNKFSRGRSLEICLLLFIVGFCEGRKPEKMSMD